MGTFSNIEIPEAVLERARAGEAEALEQVYVTFDCAVRKLAHRLLAHHAAAEDVAQDVFVDVITHLHQFEGRGSFAGWVRSITVSRCLMHLRSPWQRSRRWWSRHVDHDDAAAGGLTEADEGVLRADLGDTIDLDRALARIGDTTRAVVWLHDVEGYTHAEIGRLFGASASFSKSQLARGYERLRAELQTETVGPCMPASSTY